MKLLQINAGIFGQDSQSTQLADHFVSEWQARHPEGDVVTRDFAVESVPHLDGFRFGAFLAAPEQRTPEQDAVVAYSDQLIEEVRQADTLVIGLPMYNFSVPSTLKAWFDHIARAGVTFKYTETGPVGLLDSATKVRVVAARGGLYQGTPKDTQTDYVRLFLGFLGLTDVQFVYAEGLSMGGDSKEEALQNARGQIAAMI